MMKIKACLAVILLLAMQWVWAGMPPSGYHKIRVFASKENNALITANNPPPVTICLQRITSSGLNNTYCKAIKSPAYSNTSNETPSYITHNDSTPLEWQFANGSGTPTYYLQPLTPTNYATYWQVQADPDCNDAHYSFAHSSGNILTDAIVSGQVPKTIAVNANSCTTVTIKYVADNSYTNVLGGKDFPYDSTSQWLNTLPNEDKQPCTTGPHQGKRGICATHRITKLGNLVVGGSTVEQWGASIGLDSSHGGVVDDISFYEGTSPVYSSTLEDYNFNQGSYQMAQVTPPTDAGHQRGTSLAWFDTQYSAADLNPATWQANLPGGAYSGDDVANLWTWSNNTWGRQSANGSAWGFDAALVETTPDGYTTELDSSLGFPLANDFFCAKDRQAWPYCLSTIPVWNPVGHLPYVWKAHVGATAKRVIPQGRSDTFVRLIMRAKMESMLTSDLVIPDGPGSNDGASFNISTWLSISRHRLLHKANGNSWYMVAVATKDGIEVADGFSFDPNETRTKIPGTNINIIGNLGWDNLKAGCYDSIPTTIIPLGCIPEFATNHSVKGVAGSADDADGDWGYYDRNGDYVADNQQFTEVCTNRTCNVPSGCKPGEDDPCQVIPGIRPHYWYGARTSVISRIVFLVPVETVPTGTPKWRLLSYHRGADFSNPNNPSNLKLGPLRAKVRQMKSGGRSTSSWWSRGQLFLDLAFYDQNRGDNQSFTIKSYNGSNKDTDPTGDRAINYYEPNLYFDYGYQAQLENNFENSQRVNTGIPLGLIDSGCSTDCLR
jgi:hypothetical protein